VGHIAVGILLAVNLTYAALFASDYGQSWDDPGDAAYGQVALRAYAGSRGYLNTGDRMYYGPIYFMVSSGLTQAVQSVVPGSQHVDVRHFLNFATFQIAILAFYTLARRLVAYVPAILTSLLFASQPVLFGHAFINQKDTPFLAAFLAAMALGLWVTDGSRTKPEQNGLDPRDTPNPSVLGAFMRGWQALHVRERTLILFLALAGGVVAVDLWWGRTILTGLESILGLAYRGEAWGPLSRLFALVASDAHKTSLEAYVAKLDGVFSWARLVGTYLAALPAAAMGLAIARRGGDTGIDQRRALRRVVPAAVALGVVMSIRVVGVFAGVLVSLGMFVEGRRKSLLDLVVYWGTALSVCYLTWPFLWDAPIIRFYEAAKLVAQFPSHFVLFQGHAMSSGGTPWNYLPTLLSIQLTEPAVLAMALGLFAVRAAWREGNRARLLLGVLAAWFLVPLLASMVLRVRLYSNFRQVLFALPPIFLLAGLALQFGWERLRSPGMRVVLALVVLFPGIAGIVRLRPYEYTYYNESVGGTKGVEGLFTHDYWCTSYREAMSYINTHAPPGARVAISEPYEAAASFARPDLDLVRSRADPLALYRLRCNNQGDFTYRNLATFPVAHVVMRSGVVLSVVFQREGTPSTRGTPSDRMPTPASSDRIIKGLARGPSLMVLKEKMREAEAGYRTPAGVGT